MNIRRVLLDVDKSIDRPTLPELAQALSDASGVTGVNRERSALLLPLAPGVCDGIVNALTLASATVLDGRGLDWDLAFRGGRRGWPACSRTTAQSTPACESASQVWSANRRWRIRTPRSHESRTAGGR